MRKRADALAGSGRVSAAQELYRDLLAQAPDDHEVTVLLGMTCISQEQYDEGARWLSRAIELGVNAAPVHCACGMALRMRGAYGEAETHCRIALEKAPEEPSAYEHLGRAIGAQGRYREALEILARGRKLRPDHAGLVMATAELLERSGEFTASLAVIRPFLEAGETSPELVLMFARLSAHTGENDRAFALVTTALSDTSVAPALRRKLHFSAGNLLDAAGRPGQAMAHFHEANNSVPTSFDPGRHVRFVDALRNAFTRETLASLRGAGNPSRRPVFILGMPRSGTSLVEQILSCHPQVYGAGELANLEVAVRRIGVDYPDVSQLVPRLAVSGHGVIGAAASGYLSAIERMAGNEVRITDKMPNNFLYAGFIQTLFPNAVVIHTRRNPMDVCLSCYFMEFAGAQEFSWRLEHLGAYYREYHRLMAHWRDVLSLPVLEVQYEELVDDVESVSREITEFCGLDWDKRVLRFYESRRAVQTASYNQVRKPVYRSSVGHWRAYREWIEPLGTIVGDLD